MQSMQIISNAMEAQCRQRLMYQQSAAGVNNSRTEHRAQRLLRILIQVRLVQPL
jgi:hypothetical protein